MALVARSGTRLKRQSLSPLQTQRLAGPVIDEPFDAYWERR